MKNGALPKPRSGPFSLLAYFLFVLAFVPNNRSVLAQTTDEQIATAEHAASDSLKVMQLNKIAAKIAPENTAKALEIVNRSMEHAGKNLLLKAETFRTLGLVYRENQRTDKSIDAYKQALGIYQDLNHQKGIAAVYEKMGTVYKKGGDIPKAIGCFKQSIETAKKAGEWEQAKKSYKEAAGIYAQNGQNPQALALLLDQLSYAQNIKPVNHFYLASANMDLTYNHFQAGNNKEALSYALESYEHAQISKDDYQLLDAYNTIGACYKNLKQTAEAIKWYEKAIQVMERSEKYKKFLASVLVNTGIAYYEIHENEKGLEYKKRALKICEELNDHLCLMNNFIATGIDLVEQDKNYKEGITYLKQAEALSDEHGSLYANQYIYEGLYKAYSGMGEYKNAFDYMSKFLVNRDSILSTEKQQQMGELEAKYESDRKQQQIELLGRNKRIQELQLLQNQSDLDKQIAENRAKENSILLLEKDKDLKTASLKKKEAEAIAQKSRLKLLNEQKRITDSENRNQRYIIYSFIGGLILLVVLLLNIFRGYQQKKKANLEISMQKAELQIQKDIVDEKNKEILDSINYAKRLQEAILPSPKTVSEYLKQFFILYKPKDIVAGDFYWLEAIEDKKNPGNRLILFAAADCTGHGVPGALVSVVCSNALNRAVKEFNITDTGKILDKVRELVIETFEKSDKEVKDGMDISLCSLNLKTNELLWSGANNPLWILKKGASEITEIKPDKQPIGRYMAPQPFKTHAIQLDKEDAIYLFTDGYADQFGGPKGKKFKYSNLGKFISEIGSLQMDRQKEQLHRTLENWQGDLEQVDDVCIIGIKL